MEPWYLHFLECIFVCLIFFRYFIDLHLNRIFQHWFHNIINTTYRHNFHFSFLFLLSVFSAAPPLFNLRETNSFADECLYAHNVARSWHTDTPDMTWDEDLASQMQNYLDSKVNTVDDVPPSCNHPNGCGYGENQYDTEGEDTTSPPPCANAVFEWYQESYNPNAFDYSKAFYWQDDVEHFTQVIWKESTKVGCGIAQNTNSKKWYIFCMYQSYGNVATKSASLKNIHSTKSGYVQPTSPADFKQNWEKVTVVRPVWWSMGGVNICPEVLKQYCFHSCKILLSRKNFKFPMNKLKCCASTNSWAELLLFYRLCYHYVLKPFKHVHAFKCKNQTMFNG